MDITKLFDLSDRVIIITGAAGNLGSKYAEGLSQAGANLVLADLDYARCKKLGKQLESKYSVKTLAVKLDLTNKISIKNMVSKSMKEFSKIDVLINNAAYQGNQKTRKIKFEDFPLN